jgi:SAM-dependent methyltransferase
MCCCARCGFVFNSTFEPALLNYGQDYDNTQTFSPAFTDYVDSLVRHLVEEAGVRNCRVVEVGCGNGVFLRKLVERAGGSTVGYGFDPAYMGPDVALGGRLLFQKRFYDGDAADVRAEAIVCRHVIEHVAEPLALLRSVRQAVRAAPDARVFFETPCVEWILQHSVVWDFFYEHCSLFSARSLALAFERAGFQTRSVRHVFGGQYLWLEAAPGEVTAAWPDATARAEMTQRFAALERQRQQTWTTLLDRLARRGRVALWGAGSKGVTFANLVDPDGQTLACVVDMNPRKQGKFLSGTGHRIVALEHLGKGGVSSVLVLNPNYTAEIAHVLRSQGRAIDVIDLMAAEPCPPAVA